MAKELRFEIEAIDRFSKELDRLTDKISEINKRFESMGKQGAKAGEDVGSGANKAGGALALLRSRFVAVTAAVGGAIFAFSKLKSAVDKFVDTAGRFEFYQVRLSSMMGSVEEGRKVFEQFNELAATTPFTLERVVQAGATLRAFMGDLFDPKMVKIVADLAAYMGTDIVEAASAMGRAFAGGAGAADIFRERGILTLIKMKSGIQDLTKLTLPEFRKVMMETFLDESTGIIGATNRLSKTIIGLQSNFDDAMTRISAAIGRKFMPIYKSALKTAIGLANQFLDVIDSQEDQIRNQQIEFNALINLLKNVNLHEKVRAEVIKELNDKYKSYLGNLDLEKASLEDLAKLQQRVNAEFEKRIKLAVAEKIVQKYQQRIQDLTEELLKAQRDLERFRDEEERVNEQLKNGVVYWDATTRAVLIRRQRIKELNKEIAEEYKKLQQEVAQLKELKLELGETGDSAEELVQKVSASTVKIAEDARQAVEQRINQMRELPSKEVAEKMVKQFESLRDKIDSIIATLTIDVTLSESRRDELILQVTELMERLEKMRPIYLRAKLVLEGDDKIEPKVPEIDKITEDAFERMREVSNAIWDEQVQRAMESAWEIGQRWEEGLNAMAEIERMAAENRWEWEKNFRLQQLEEKWNLLTKEQKMLLGGEEYYQKLRTKIIQQANEAQLQMMLSTASSAINGFISLMQAMSDAGSDQVKAVKILMGIQALIDAYAAINRAFSTLPTPVAIVASIGIGAATMANVMKIQSQDVPRPKIRNRAKNVKISRGGYSTAGANVSMATGGIVPSRPIVGADTVPALLSTGEAVISRRVVSQYRPQVERMVTGEITSPTEPLSLTISPVITVNAIDSQSVAEFVESIEFRDAFADAIEDGLLRLRAGGALVEVQR